LPRHRDHNDLVGNLAEGQKLFAPAVVELPDGRSYTWEDELARIRAHNFNHAYSAPAYRPAPFRHRSLRRGV
jgi:hypothetical protein